MTTIAPDPSPSTIDPSTIDPSTAPDPSTTDQSTDDQPTPDQSTSDPLTVRSITPTSEFRILQALRWRHTDVRPRRSVTATQEFRVLRALKSRHVVPDTATRDWAGVVVTGAAAVLSLLACIYFLRQDLLLGYHDSFAHLEISRRVLTGRTAGIAQLGTIWLPLPHLLQALFAWNSTLYLSGLAGALVSMAAFVGCSNLIYRIARTFAPDRSWPAIAAAAVFMTNPNLLYHQTTAMDELLFFLCALAATYRLIQWANTERATFLLEAAIATMLAMLCRYEAWFLAGVFTAAVLVMARRARLPWRDVRGLTGMFAAFGVLTASFGWMVYNLLITGNPLNFLFGPNSSADQMTRRQTDVAVGSWSKSVRAYAGALVADYGLAVLAAAAIGLVVFVLVERGSNRSLPVLALGMVIPFYVVSIEKGLVPIEVPPVNEYLLNLRFGLVAGLPAAILIGYLLSRLPARLAVIASILATVALTFVSVSTFRSHNLVTVAEASQHLVDQRAQAEVADFLDRQTTGPILLNLVGNERVAFPVIDRVIYEGTRQDRVNIWSSALRDPAGGRRRRCRDAHRRQTWGRRRLRRARRLARNGRVQSRIHQRRLPDLRTRLLNPHTVVGVRPTGIRPDVTIRREGVAHALAARSRRRTPAKVYRARMRRWAEEPDA